MNPPGQTSPNDDVISRYRRLDRVRVGLFYAGAAIWLLSVCLAVSVRGRGAGAIVPLPVLAALPAIHWLVRRRHRRIASNLPPKPEPEPKCANCGYILLGLHTNRCPECNWAFDPRFEQVVSEDERIRWHGAVGALTAGILLFSYVLALGILQQDAVLVWLGAAGTACVVALAFAAGRRAMKRLRVAMPPSLPCPKCREAMLLPVGNQCPYCGCVLRAEDVFRPVRPWNVADRRYRRLRRRVWAVQGGIMASFFVLAACGVWYSQWGFGRLTGLQRTILPGALGGAGLSLWLGRKWIYRRIGRWHTLLFSMAAPTCLNCREDLTSRPPNGRCPRCGKVYDSRAITG